MIESLREDLVGPIIVRRVRPPIHVSRSAVLVICAVSIAVDLVLQLLFLRPIWSGLASGGALPMTLVGVMAGAMALLVPAAFILRSPDAWRVRRLLLVGALLGAAAELARSGAAAVSGLHVMQVSSGAASTWQFLLPLADVVSRLAMLGGAVGTLLFAVGLARLSERSAIRSSRRVLAVALVAIGTLALWGLLASPPTVVRLADWAWTFPALLAAGIVTELYRAWVILTSWSAGETPRRAWTLAAAAASVGLASLAIGNLLIVAGLASTLWFTVLGLVGIGGTLCFVAALLDGLGASPAQE